MIYGNMKYGLVIAFLLSLSQLLVAQEVLVPATLYNPPSQRVNTKSSIPVELPFIDDFSSNYLNPLLWANCQVNVNNGYGPNPPTIGVATLDAINESGSLYANISSPFSGDTLLSMPIRLDSMTSTISQPISPSDSIYLSFYYIPGGAYSDFGGRVGDIPEGNDSLILDFYDSHNDIWRTIWSTPGVNPDDLYSQTGHYWQYVVLPINDSVYFSNQFRFRFRNICSLDPATTTGLIGNSDQWHIDCIYLDHDRSFNDRFEHDVAFVLPAPSLLKSYTAMPARQYRYSEMASNLDMLITNRYNQTIASHYEYKIFSSEGELLYRYDGGYENIPPFFPDNTYQENPYHAHPAVEYQFLDINGKTSFIIRHIVKEGMAGDQYPQNDSTVYNQIFADYYAYDDGSAESGYGLTSTSSQVYVANAFILNEPDSLLKVRMYFNHTRNDENTGIAFRLVVWNNNNGMPGSIVYRDNNPRFPIMSGINQFCDYQLDYPVPLNGLVFIGIEQEGGNYLNLGFDRNTNHADRIFYCIGSEWLRSSVAGSLMFRPCFTLGSSELNIHTVSENVEPLIYPNPASNILHIMNILESCTVMLYNIYGQLVHTSYATSGELSIDISPMPTGVYFMSISANGRKIYSKKIMIVR